VVNGGVESNHVSWTAGSIGPGTGTGTGPGAGTNPATGTGPGTGGGPGAGTPTPCIQYSGYPMGNSGHLSRTLFAHYLDGTGLTAVIDWAYFSGYGPFRSEALPLAVGAVVSGWSAPFGSDMQKALGHFTIRHTSDNCYLIYDHYDFSWQNNKENLVYFPFWALQIAGARAFDEKASGDL
jgi:hypothetical protein